MQAAIFSQVILPHICFEEDAVLASFANNIASNNIAT